MKFLILASILILFTIEIVGVQESFATEPQMPQFWLEPPEIVFSNLPKVGETAEVTVIFNHNHLWGDMESADDSLHELEVAISGDTLVFVDSSYDTKEDRYNFGNLIVFDVMEYYESEKIIQVTIKSIAEGESRIHARVMDAQSGISFYTELEQAMLLNDYYELYPEYLIEKTKAKEMEDEKQRNAGLIPEEEPSEDYTLQVPASFVDETKNPQIYIERYNSEPDYKKWFDDNYSKYNSIYHAVGLSQTSIIPSPVKQLKNNIFSENIICKDGLELIFKQNNSPACVKQSTAEKLVERGWALFFPNSQGLIYGTFPQGEPHWGDVTISISKLPNLGETAVVTVTNNELVRGQPPGRDTAPLSISLSPQFEFVDLEPTRTGDDYTVYEIEMDIIDKESISFSATIKAIGEGNGRITGFSDYNNPNTPETIQMIINENKNTVLGAIIDPTTQPSSFQTQSICDYDTEGEPEPCGDEPEPQPQN